MWQNKMYEIVKRDFDIVFAMMCLLLTSPLLLITAIAVKLSSPGPIFYFGVRSGRDGIPFHIIKLRTMVEDAERLGGPSTALNDPRLISIGAFMRKYKLDELPQFYNILIGDMSFVGPRPQVERYTKLYVGEEKLILSVRPGLTDFATLHFINMDKVLGDDGVDEKYLLEVEPKKNLLRIKYVREMSLRVDFMIMLRTVLLLFGVK